MNVYLIYPDVSSYHGLPYHPGLASLAAVLQQGGHQVKVGYFTSRDQYQDIVKEVVDFQPGVVGFTTVETQFGYVQELAALIKEARPECTTVVGGTSITLGPEAVLEPKSSALDCGMRGESEYALLQLVEKVQRGEDYHGVNNLCYRDPVSGELVKNPLNPQIEALETIPHPSTEVFDYQRIINKDAIALFHFSRGCPYPCTYCAARVLGLQYGSMKESIRVRSVDSTIEEIKLTLQKYEVPSSTLLEFTDDLFTLNKKWLYEFCDRYEKEIARPFSCTARSNIVSPEMFDRLKTAGCYKVMMSIESGNDFIRNQVMKRGISRKVLFQSFEWAYKFDIKTCAPCIVGVPYETPEMLDDSIQTVAQLNVTDNACNIFYPYKGTPLRKVCEENGFMPDVLSENVQERFNSILNLPTITKEQVLYYHDNWEELVYKHKPLKQRVERSFRRTYKAAVRSRVGNQIRSFVNKHEYTTRVKNGLRKVIGA
jgi:anaerobic magnesium-protoporphyrin IX monomethyl ester cyclase